MYLLGIGYNMITGNHRYDQHQQYSLSIAMLSSCTPQKKVLLACLQSIHSMTTDDTKFANEI
jgi:hypothetical protein